MILFPKTIVSKGETWLISFLIYTNYTDFIETAEVLKDLSVHVCGLSNNHIFDFGREGAVDTLDALDKVNIAYTGFGINEEDSRKNFSYTSGDESICIIAVCEHEYSYALKNRMGSRPYDPYDTMADIRNAKSAHDRVIVIYHGGKEYCQYPSPRLRKACKAMVDNGADVVICQHSHCIGCYEIYDDAHILYGQGNFHFVKSHPNPLWHTSLAVKYDSKTNEIFFTPLISQGASITIAKEEDKEKTLHSFYERNSSLLDGSWENGWNSFCQSYADFYLDVIGQAHTEKSTESDNHRFAHYLDCEAHTDVWRTLNPTANLTNELE